MYLRRKFDRKFGSAQLRDGDDKITSYVHEMGRQNVCVVLTKVLPKLRRAELAHQLARLNIRVRALRMKVANHPSFLVSRDAFHKLRKSDSRYKRVFLRNYDSGLLQ
jgi:hypothetical protein